MCNRGPAWLGVAAVALASSAAAQPSAPIDKQPDAPIPQRVADHFGRMTLQPSLDRRQIGRHGSAKVSVTRAADEVVQMYVHPQLSSVVQPLLQLAGFERIHLNPGEAKTVSSIVGPGQLAIWNRQMQHVVEPGVVEVSVGANVTRLESVQLQVGS